MGYYYSLLFSRLVASKAKPFVAVVVRDPTLPNQRRPITSKSSKPNIRNSNFTRTVNYLINSCGLSPENANSAAKRVDLQSPERADSVLALLRSHGFSQTHISKLVRTRPQLLLADPEQTLLPKLEFFSSLGVSREGITKALASNATLLGMSLRERIIPTYDFLRSLLSEKNAVSVIKRGSWIFLEGPSKNVLPNIGVLRDLGMSQSCISLLLAHGTRVLMQNPEKFGNVVDEVKLKGFDLENSNSVGAIRVLSGNNSKVLWDRNFEAFSRWGWSEGDVLSAFRRNPGCMALSEKRIMQLMDLFVNQMGWPSEMIARNSVVLSYSLEKRIIPRCSVVKVLLSKGLIKLEDLSLCGTIVPVEKHFLKRFVAKYLNEVPQLSNVYQGKVAVLDV